jgi:hypothetical protein
VINITNKDLEILQEILNEELLEYLRSGYTLNDEYVINLRNLLKKLNLKEIYNFDERFKKE